MGAYGGAKCEPQVQAGTRGYPPRQLAANSDMPWCRRSTAVAWCHTKLLATLVHSWHCAGMQLIYIVPDRGGSGDLQDLVFELVSQAREHTPCYNLISLHEALKKALYEDRADPIVLILAGHGTVCCGAVDYPDGKIRVLSLRPQLT